MNLQLSLKKKWFEMTKSGIKTEDYREITPYWCNRFLLNNLNSMSVKKWDSILLNYGIEAAIKCYPITYKKFNTNTMTLGYPKATDTERMLKLDHKGIEIRTGNPKWGAEPGKTYFVIKHGGIIK